MLRAQPRGAHGLFASLTSLARADVRARPGHAGPGRAVRHGPRPRTRRAAAQGRGPDRSSCSRPPAAGAIAAAHDADLSVTVMQIVALRAQQRRDPRARPRTIEKAIAYVRSLASQRRLWLPGRRRPRPADERGRVALAATAGPVRRPAAGTQEPAIVTSLSRGADRRQVARRARPVLLLLPLLRHAGHYQAGGKHWNDWHPRSANCS